MNSNGYSENSMIQIHRGQTHGDMTSGPQTMEIGIDLPMGSSLSPDLQSPGHDSVSSSVTVGSGASSGCRQELYTDIG